MHHDTPAAAGSRLHGEARWSLIAFDGSALVSIEGVKQALDSQLPTGNARDGPAMLDQAGDVNVRASRPRPSGLFRPATALALVCGIVELARQCRLGRQRSAGGM